MKVQEVILQAMAKKITWYQAAEIIGISDRHMRPWRERYEEGGFRSAEQHREFVLSAEEEAKYLAASPEPLASVATILADTGLHLEECYRLRWEFVTWVNGRHGTLMVTHGNTAAARRVLPMTPRARAILRSRWEAAGKPLEGYVWPAPSKSGHMEPSSVKKQHAKALKLSKVRPFVLYSLLAQGRSVQSSGVGDTSGQHATRSALTKNLDSLFCPNNARLFTIAQS